MSVEIDRLRAFHAFDDDVLQTVSAVADQYRAQTWADLQQRLPETTIFGPAGGKPIEVLDIVPSDYEQTLVYHLPMANSLDEATSLHTLTIADSLPDTRVIAIGNPGVPSAKTGGLGFGDIAEVWHGDLRAVVDPTLQYLEHQGIEQAEHTGFSYGADRVAAAVRYAHDYDQTSHHAIMMDPASVKQRPLLGLVRDFASTNSALQGYVEGVGSHAYLEARKRAEIRAHGMVGVFLSLGRLSNIAVAHALAMEGFEARVAEALDAQPEAQADILWGSKSELAVDSNMLSLTARLATNYGERVRSTRLIDQRHAMGVDIFLHAAMIVQSLKD